MKIFKKIYNYLFSSTSKPKPKLSCFVQGVIKSIRTESDKWEYKYISKSVNKFYVEYLPMGWVNEDIIIGKDYEELVWSLFLNEELVNLTIYEQMIIHETVIEYLENPRIQKIKKEEENKRKTSMAKWEKLGCPENNS